MAGGGALKCNLMCASQDYGETFDTEFTYAVKEEPDSDEEEQKMEVVEEDMVHLTV